MQRSTFRAQSVSREPRRRGTLIAGILVVALYALLGAYGLSQHVMWRDEMNTWLLIRDTGSLAELFSLVRYQGHAPLWALLNSGAFAIDPAPASMKVLNWLICVSAIAVFWWRAPFAFYQKVLFSLGYAPFFEYFIISRPYSLLLLFTILYCAVHELRRLSYLPAAVVLAFLATSHAYGLVVALVLVMLLIHEALADPAARASLHAPRRRVDAAIALALVAGGMAISVLILMPPADSINAGGREALLSTQIELEPVLHRLGKLLGAFTLIEPARRWPDQPAGVLAGLAIMGLCLWGLRRSRFGFWLFLIANALIWIGNVRHGGGVSARHFAYTFILLVAALWLMQRDTGRAVDPRQAQGRGDSVFLWAFVLFLICHAAGGVVRYVHQQFYMPYSASYPVARFLDDPQFADAVLFGTPAPRMAAISGYLGRPIHYPELDREGSYFILDGGYRPLDDFDDALARLRALRGTTPPERRIVLIATSELGQESGDFEGLTLTEIARFPWAYLDSERFYLYEVTE